VVLRFGPVSIRQSVQQFIICAVAMMMVSSAAHAQSSSRNERERSVSAEDEAAERSSEAAADAAENGISTTVPEFEPDRLDTVRTNRRRANRETLSERQLRNVRNAELAALRASDPSEYESYVSAIAGKPLRRFGANLILPDSREFTPPPDVTVPPDYQINAGDTLILGLTGSIQVSDLELIVDPQGAVFVPNIGSIRVGGVRFGDVEAVIARQVARFYRGFDISVQLGTLNGITVYVTGFAAKPGAYTLSSVSTLINAVISAGGPAAGGSFRSIQLRRNGAVVSDFDLYDLLINGDKSGDMRLQNGDIVHILPVGNQVTIFGSVNNEAIFEAAPGDTIKDILFYAGGVTTVADNSRLYVFDPVTIAAGGWEEVMPEAISARSVKRSEIVRVLSSIGLARPLNTQSVLVTISGEVARPGQYYLNANATVGELLAKAGGLTANAFPYAAALKRLSVAEQQKQSYDRALADLQLLLTTQPLVYQRQRNIPQGEQLQLINAIVEQLKQQEPDGRIVLDTTPAETNLPVNLTLLDGDTLLVPARPITVGVFGAVVSPASFEYRDGKTIGDYLQLAGGVQSLGDKSEIFVIRANGRVEKSRGGLFGGKNVLKQPLYPGDLIFVPVDANRGSFLADLQNITQTLFSAALSVAAIEGLTSN
jgi:protein involved in polysaccharide export with SLBB domain